MEPLKLRLLNQFGASDSLNNPDEIEVYFPYESTDSLVKRMTNGHVKIINDLKGEFSVSISSFELQGMPVGENQNFVVKIKNGSKIREGVFERCLHIRTIKDRKVIFK